MHVEMWLSLRDRLAVPGGLDGLLFFCQQVLNPFVIFIKQVPVFLLCLTKNVKRYSEDGRYQVLQRDVWGWVNTEKIFT